MHAVNDMGDAMKNRCTRLPEHGQPLPEGLRWAIEMLSGYDMSDVRVYYASNVPARVGARALARGTDIHVQMGAEDALPHEAWHVVQQMQGRVTAMADVNGMPINDDPQLEKEADTMGAMATALSFSGMWRRVKGALTKVRIEKPVVQPQYLVVNGIRYEAVANENAGIKDAAQLLKDIGTNVKLSVMPEADFQTIVSDMVWEKCEFSSWAALAKEIEIRRVGYAVETTLRSMLKSNMAKDGVYQDAKTAMLELEIDLREMAEEASSSPTDSQEIDELRKKVDKAKLDVEALDKGILRWGSNSFPNYAHRDKQMMGWWLGLQMDEPKIANCWECALMSLVKTTFLKIPKEYMIWCVEQIDTLVGLDFDPKNVKTVQISRLYTCALRNMDYYFPRYGVPEIDASKERFRPKNDVTSCFDLPLDVVIPCGRLLIFDYLAHVAISTGELREITTQEGRKAWGRTMGHGIIDLNAKGETLRERTIEDFARAGNCNNQLIVAPFPICTDTKRIVVKGSVPPTKDEIEAYQRDLNEAATLAYDSAVRDLEQQRDQALKKKPESKARIESNHKSAVSAARVKFEKAVLAAGKNLDKKFKKATDVVPQAKQEVFELSYVPADPYGGESDLLDESGSGMTNGKQLNRH